MKIQFSNLREKNRSNFSRWRLLSMTAVMILIVIFLNYNTYRGPLHLRMVLNSPTSKWLDGWIGRIGSGYLSQLLRAPTVLKIGKRQIPKWSPELQAEEITSSSWKTSWGAVWGLPVGLSHRVRLYRFSLWMPGINIHLQWSCLKPFSCNIFWLCRWHFSTALNTTHYLRVTLSFLTPVHIYALQVMVKSTSTLLRGGVYKVLNSMEDKRNLEVEEVANSKQCTAIIGRLNFVRCFTFL